MIQKFRGIEPKIDGTCYIAPGSAVIGDVTINSNSSIWHNAVIRGDIDGILIGKNSNVQDGCVLHCIENVKLIIGNNVTIGHGAILHSCKIGDNTLIGMGSVILDNAVIGNNCLIGAGAVVTPRTQIPDGSLVMGSPARVKRELTQSEIDAILRNAEEYVTLANEYMKERSV